MEGSSAMQEFLIFRNSQNMGEGNLVNSPTVFETRSFTWTTPHTNILLDLYKKYRVQVGTLHIRSFKKMWEIIAEEFKKMYDILISPSNCENRWRVLERNYKKYVDNKNQTGAGYKFFEFAEEMDKILGKKKYIKPTVILTSATISKPPDEMQSAPEELQTTSSGEQKENEKSPNNTVKRPKVKFTKLNRSGRRQKTTDILEKIRFEKNQRHREKLSFEKEKFEKLYELEKRKQEARERKNYLLKENNDLQRQSNILMRKLLQTKKSNIF